MPRQKRTAAPEPEEQSTALALPDTPALVAAYDDQARMDAILARIEAQQAERKARKIATLKDETAKLEGEA